METAKERKSDARAPRARWKQNPEGVRAEILKVATEEFAANGLSGARIDEIAARTRTSKRMIYYYFGDKERLYHRVLEEIYRKIRLGEKELALESLPPVAALDRLVRFTFRHHSKNPDIIRIVMIENIHDGRHLAQTEGIVALNVPAIEALTRIYEGGVAEGVFRPNLDPIELHWMITAPCFFQVSNKATFSQLFEFDLDSDTGFRRLEDHVVENALRFVLKPEMIPRFLPE